MNKLRRFANRVGVKLVRLQWPPQRSCTFELFTAELFIAGFVGQAIDLLPNWVEGHEAIKVAPTFAPRIWKL